MSSRETRQKFVSFLFIYSVYSLKFHVLLATAIPKRPRNIVRAGPFTLERTVYVFHQAAYRRTRLSRNVSKHSLFGGGEKRWKQGRAGARESLHAVERVSTLCVYIYLNLRFEVCICVIGKIRRPRTTLHVLYTFLFDGICDAFYSHSVFTFFDRYTSYIAVYIDSN